MHVRRHSIPFVWEFPDPETFARMLASTGPAYEAIQSVGAEAFHRCCLEVATERVREGLPLRAEIDCVGFTARVPFASSTSLLGEAPTSAGAASLSSEDMGDLGFVANVTKLWMHDAAASDELFTLISSVARAAGLSIAERGVATIVATALAGDSYCPLAWGNKLAAVTSLEVAASVVRGSDELLDDRGRAVAAWARKVASEPRSATAADLDQLIAVGFDGAQILRLTLFISLRIAFVTVNGALGAQPEQEYVDLVDDAVRGAWQAALGP